MPEEIAVVTIACYRNVDQLNEQTRPLRESFTRWSSGRVAFWLMQVGRQWYNFYQNKVVQFLADLKGLSKESRFKYLLYCDAADTLLLRDPYEAVSILRAAGKPILLGAEAVCWPWSRRHGPLFQPSPSGLRYPQAGVWAGEYDAVVAMLEAIVSMVETDRENYTEGRFGFRTEDQCCWIEQVVRGAPVALDLDAALVANINSSLPGQFEMTDHGVHCPKTHKQPIVLHWAGGPNSKKSLRDYAQRLNKEK